MLPPGSISCRLDTFLQTQMQEHIRIEQACKFQYNAFHVNKVRHGYVEVHALRYALRERHTAEGT